MTNTAPIKRLFSYARPHRRDLTYATTWSVANKVMAVSLEPFVLHGQVLRVSLSAGIAMFPQHGGDFEELARHADGAMYAAKRGGRMQVRCYVGPEQEAEIVSPPQTPSNPLSET